MADCCTVKDAAPAPTVMNCPASGTKSKRADALTVKALVRHLPFGLGKVQYYFCEAPGCDVVYFAADPGAATFRRGDVLVRVGVKEPGDNALLCYCFGVTRNDIREEITRTGNSTATDRIRAEVKAGHCACEVKNPSGKCCLGNVTRAIQEALGAVGAKLRVKED